MTSPAGIRTTAERTVTARKTTARGRTRPSRSLENSLLGGLGPGALVAGMDEVGRGALAGPVTVGVAVVTEQTSRRMPPGLADSKLLTPQARQDLVSPVRRWCTGWAVGHADPDEIDELGIIAALRLAGRRALADLAAAGLSPGVIILDGVHDWLSEPAQGELFAPEPPLVRVPGTDLEPVVPPVRTQVKADMTSAVVAAASVLAKVERDAIMVDLDAEHPEYCWAANKGYSSAEHIAALREHGACALHRRSWHLPGIGDELGVRVGDDDDADVEVIVHASGEVGFGAAEAALDPDGGELGSDDHEPHTPDAADLFGAYGDAPYAVSAEEVGAALEPAGVVGRPRGQGMMVP
ncbi:ribonuclease HII [Georgenia yuyongxinii]|uniref:Ribonuclease n=1 Tax=Georgenia yuyongxinii TaxID=2589797 RepID=A0A552WRB8_9MICO|nr:ribonuclease HII [Georgenia yuyongxinii]